MKKLNFLFVLMLIISGTAFSQGKYKVEKGFIEYKMDMMGMSVTTQTYFKDYGETSAQTADMFGQKTRTLLTKDYVYSLDMGSKTGTKMAVDGETGAVDNIDYDNIPQEMKDKYHIVESGKGTVLGKECKIIEMESDGAKNRLWVWNNIPLKMVVEKGGMQMTMEATKVETNPSFPAGIFEVPADFTITDAGNE